MNIIYSIINDSKKTAFKSRGDKKIKESIHNNSIGRWKTDLTAQEIECCETFFYTFMNEFNYTVNKA